MLALSHASKNRTLPAWQPWLLAPSDASRHRTLPGRQRWMLAQSHTSRHRTLPWLAGLDARPIACLEEPEAAGAGRGSRAAAVKRSRRGSRRHRTQDGCLPTTHWGVGSDGCSPHRMLLQTGRPGWQGWMLALSDASQKRTLPGWQRWRLAPSHASRNRTFPGYSRAGCSPYRMLLRTGRCQLGSHGCSRHRMLLDTGRYQVGSDGCSPNRILLDTGRYHGWQGWMLALSHGAGRGSRAAAVKLRSRRGSRAAGRAGGPQRNRTLAGWQDGCLPTTH